MADILLLSIAMSQLKEDWWISGDMVSQALNRFIDSNRPTLVLYVTTGVGKFKSMEITELALQSAVVSGDLL